ncbi:enoyl-CoA hydratase-related protein [Nocardia sp. alder85J]|uniref:enoyl-CoA hydratase-related protein n=1 Tax=Nocardia sp. alder85J TaxID=2862949 RepID=UPI001CD2ECAD|nr:enoyl-CoA hydratase-related protein [Nocardia sp. alder85J]MCX4093168.1 enoyl-CoA hydratase-related protein [Nocardia sp. alder85J]
MSTVDNRTTPAGFSAIREDRVLRVTLTNPARKNAIDYHTMVALGDLFTTVGEDRAVRAIVLTGEGRDFCTGADLSGVEANVQRGITPELTMDAANRMVRTLLDVPVPVVASIRGAAAGVGVALALAADITYAASDSYLLLAFINVGLMPDGGAAAMVAAAAGRARAAELALLGERLPAVEAAAAGLITRAVPVEELDAIVAKAVAKLAHGPRRAQQLTKRALNEASLSTLDAALAAEKAGQVELLDSPDFAEGAIAMLTKRKPVFGD